MHIVDNLDREKGIEEQLENFAVAVNVLHPKPEDFVYTFVECETWQKDILKGMAIAADAIDRLWENKEVLETSYEPEVIQNIREAYQQTALTEAQTWIIMQMAEVLISFVEMGEE